MEFRKDSEQKSTLSPAIKASRGNFFEDFSLGQVMRHATPRTLTTGDAALYTALYGSRFAINQSEIFARDAGYPAAPLDDLLVFHMVFGKTVGDVSRNAIANLGYASCRFLKPVFPGDTLMATSTVTGLVENSNGKTGTVYVCTSGFNQHRELVLEFSRWVMVQKRAEHRVAGKGALPELQQAVTAAELGAACPQIKSGQWDFDASGSRLCYSDYQSGEMIDHADGVTVEEAEHAMAARLYHNTAKVHFDALEARKGRFGRRLVYGGHVMSLARALTYNGLANAFHISAINAGRHVGPFFAGGTLYAWSLIIEKSELTGRKDVGALRVLTRATRDHPASGFPTDPAEADRPGVVLELDYWVLMPM